MRMRWLVGFGIVLSACTDRNAPPPNSVTATAPASQLPEQDRRLLAAATIALPPEGLTIDSLPTPTARGAQLLATYCTQCHALPAPAMHAAQDWPSVARRMWVRIDMMHGELGIASPTSADRMQLLQYLLAHAMPVAATLPEGRGRAVFEATCSRCHTLPDPRAHSPADWPTVVMRMERNMERMHVAGVTADQAQQIVGYLETVSRR